MISMNELKRHDTFRGLNNKEISIETANLKVRKVDNNRGDLLGEASILMDGCFAYIPTRLIMKKPRTSPIQSSVTSTF